MLVPTNGGTIDFVAKKAGIKGCADDVIGRLLDGVRAGRRFPSVGVGSIEVLGHRPGDPPGFSFRRIGFAVALGGLGQKTVENPDVSRWRKFFLTRVYAIDSPGIDLALHILGIPAPLRGASGRSRRWQDRGSREIDGRRALRNLQQWMG